MSSLRIDGNNNEDPKVMIMMKPHKNGIVLPFCGICNDFKQSWEMFNTLQCSHNFCIVCMHEHVASCLRGNIVIVPCPDSKCKVKYGPEHFCSLLPFEVFKRWQRVIKDCNTPILDTINVDDDDEEKSSNVEEDAIVLIESDDDDDDDDDYDYVMDKKNSNKKKNKKKRGRNVY